MISCIASLSAFRALMSLRSGVMYRRWFLLLLALTPFYLASEAQACNTLCTWQCDAPTCRAYCSPLCLPPVCSLCHNVSGVPQCVPTGGCWIACPPHQCDATECPACEVQPPSAPPDYWIQHAAPECGWRCRAGNCPKPICHEVCERPACEAAA